MKSVSSGRSPSLYSVASAASPPPLCEFATVEDQSCLGPDLPMKMVHQISTQSQMFWQESLLLFRSFWLAMRVNWLSCAALPLWDKWAVSHESSD